MTQVVNRPKRATTKVSISNSLISITPSYVLSCQSRGIVTGSSVFLGKTSRLPFFSGRLSRGWPRKPILAEKTPTCNRRSPQAAHSLRASFLARDWYDLLIRS